MNYNLFIENQRKLNYTQKPAQYAVIEKEKIAGQVVSKQISKIENFQETSLLFDSIEVAEEYALETCLGGYEIKQV